MNCPAHNPQALQQSADLRQPRRLRCWTTGAIGLMLLAHVGCSQQVVTDYGKRTGWAAGSVNGTTVLGDLFVSAGHRVRSWRYLSPSLEEAEVIVWAPDQFGLPRDEVQDWFRAWLEESESPKHLIFIGRGYDAAITYWQTVQPLSPAGQKAEVTRRLNGARAEFRFALKQSPADEPWGNWFRWEGQTPSKKVRKLSGPWARDVDADKVQIERSAQLLPSDWSAQVLLRGDGQPLVSQISVRRKNAGLGQAASQVTVIDNGSFLLNVPLVSHEHRKLATKLVAAIDSAPKKVVFLEAGQGEVSIRDEDPSGQMPTGLEMFAVWPLSGVLLHLALLGGLFALARWPIFGTPRQLPQPSLTDFSRHLHALGALLSQSGDTTFVKQTLDTYHQSTLRD